jgi:ABC-2 type transport system permease protein
MNSKIQRLKAKYRYSIILLRQLVIADFKLRYQNSILGYVWSLLKPFSLFLIMYLVFVRVLKTGGDLPYFGVYLLLGIIVWNYFTEVTNGSVAAIVGQGDLLRKVNFPRYVIIVAGSFSALINLAFNTVVLVIFMMIAKTEVSSLAVYLPLLILELFVFSLAVSFILSSLYVRFRDIGFIWEVIIQAAFFATPIMYSYTLVTERSALAAKILMFNPITQIMQDIRAILITPKTTTLSTLFGGNPWWYLVPISIVLLLAAAAGIYFRKQSPNFAEEV